MLDDDQLDRGQVEHLPCLHTHDRCPTQIITTGPTCAGDVEDDLIRFRP